MTASTISPEDARSAIDAGARLVDIRGADEHARQHIPGAINLPLDRIEDLQAEDGPVVFHCRSGMRTDANAAKLHAAAKGMPVYLMAGGIEAWRKQGHPIVTDRTQPLEIMRQVQIVAGGLVLIGVLLSLLWTPAFLGLSAFVGAGLMFAGVTGWCGMAHLLRVLPWNRRAAV
ncbi:rhodanese family protein [Novosphingopyxis sp. YJ-S2-01]|uniref:rhodanese family protein n=1 Tax=Novosphingopyxis sp. YJ-S2-01 TaxID=2794021 RepID=UPI0018DC575B|nr:rhodanese family protein [Novosphingopyxis sp. YJ-S2-01]MBH9537210.1 rhodanese family protein [Novosphingopyxis sp. YJ-S2-01]